jgi:hypothetical protein
LLAILIALNNASAEIVIYHPNFIVLIIQGSFNPLAFLFQLIIFGALIFLFLFLACWHFVFYLLIYPLVYFSVYKFMLPVFVSCIVDGISGIFLVFFCHLPICLTGCYCFSVAGIRVYNLCNYPHQIRYFNNLKYMSKSIFNEICFPYLCFICVSTLWWLVLYLIFALIC